MTIIPNLPEKNPEIFIINKFADEKLLSGFGAEVIKGEKVRALSQPTDTHIDMQLVHLGNNDFVCEKTVFDYYKSIKSINLVCGKTSLKSNYPEDVAYNIARVGKFVIHNFKYTDNVIKKYIYDNNLVCVDVAQGYSKCNVCVVDENSVITEDMGIYNACLRFGISALYISPGYVKLQGYKNGFIGGASVKINKDTLAFFGDITSHPDYKKIDDFLSKRKITALSLKKGALIDIGSVVVI